MFINPWGRNPDMLNISSFIDNGSSLRPSIVSWAVNRNKTIPRIKIIKAEQAPILRIKLTLEYREFSFFILKNQKM